MTLFCKHDWSLLREYTTQSQLGHALWAAQITGAASVESRAVYSAERKLIQVFACENCGRIKRYAETI